MDSPEPINLGTNVDLMDDMTIKVTLGNLTLAAGTYPVQVNTQFNGQNRFSHDDLVAHPQPDSPKFSVQRSRDNVSIADAGLAIFINGHLQMPAFHRCGVDQHRFGIQ